MGKWRGHLCHTGGTNFGARHMWVWPCHLLDVWPWEKMLNFFVFQVPHLKRRLQHLAYVAARSVKWDTIRQNTYCWVRHMVLAQWCLFSFPGISQESQQKMPWGDARIQDWNSSLSLGTSVHQRFREPPNWQYARPKTEQRVPNLGSNPTITSCCWIFPILLLKYNGLEWARDQFQSKTNNCFLPNK